MSKKHLRGPDWKKTPSTRPKPIAPGSPWTCSWWSYTGEMSEWDLNIRSPMMKNLATGEVLSQRDLPVGALFDANAHPENRGYYRGASDGCHIVCVLPDGNHWHIDSRASNCDMKKDDEHRCWVRHGTVGGTLHIDKNGKTCGAGAGSIKTARWHGFLHNGVLSERG